MAECSNVMNKILNSGEPCVGTWRLGSDTECGANDTILSNQYIVETLEISGAPINVFKLLGVHEQGKLIDLTGNGFPLSGGTSADSTVSDIFSTSVNTWKSSQVGQDVLASPSYIGYDFGIKKSKRTSQTKYAMAQPVLNSISSIRIKQSDNQLNRVTQIKIERSDGEYSIKNKSFTGSGSGDIVNISASVSPIEDKFLLIAVTNNQFQVISQKMGVIGIAQVNSPFVSQFLNFTIISDNIPFAVNDSFIFDFVLVWKRVDIVNLPDDNNLNHITFKNSVPSRFWRFVPMMFNGTSANLPWEVNRLELLDYESTSIDNIQDIFFLENRDRDYAQSSITLRCQYQPFDPIGDLGKFGFNILDQYVFTCSFSSMIEKLGRPIIIGDIIEVCPEVAYDQHMNLVKKYLEVTDGGWSAEGYSPGWTPLVYRFTAQQLIPGQEHRDIIKNNKAQKYAIDDSSFFSNMGNQTITADLTASETIAKLAADAVPERGSDGGTEIASGMSMYQSPNQKGSYDGNDLYIEDGLPPNGESYEEGFSLPDMDSTQDGQYFRLNYPPELNTPSRLYKFSLYKRKWIYIETDRRGEYSSHKPSVRNVLNSKTAKSLKDEL